MNRKLVCAISASALAAVMAVGPTRAVAAETQSETATANADVSALVAAATEYLSQRADHLLVKRAGPTVLAKSSVKMEAGLASETEAATEALDATRDADHAGGVDFIKADVTLSSPSLSANPDGTYDLAVTDDTRLYFKYVPGAPPYEETSVRRSFGFANLGTTPTLISQALDGAAGGPAPTTDPTSNQIGSSAAVVPSGAASTVKRPVSAIHKTLAVTT